MKHIVISFSKGEEYSVPLYHIVPLSPSHPIETVGNRKVTKRTDEPTRRSKPVTCVDARKPGDQHAYFGADIKVHGYTYTDVAAFHSIDKVFHSVRVSATSQKSGLLFLSLFFVFQMLVAERLFVA